MYSECYTFYKEPGSRQGRFFHDSYTDDAGVWKGSGTYIENALNIKLTYSDWTEPIVSYAVSETPTEEVKVYWTDTWGEEQNWFELDCIDSLGKVVYQTVSDNDVDYTIVPRRYCNPGYRFNMAQYGRIIYSFIVSEPADFVMVSVNDTERVHTFSNPPKVLRKTVKGFRAKVLWAKGQQLFEVRDLNNAPPPPLPGVPEFTNDTCYRNRDFSSKQLSKRYPFSETKYIKLVSFEAGLGKIPIDKNGMLISENCKEVITLNPVQKDSLMDILYNYNHHDSVNIIRVTQVGCYEPRHGILFCDKTNKAFAWIEICFTCSGHESNIDKNNFGDFCDGKYELLKDFMKQSGITFFAEQDKSSLKQVEEPITK